MMMEVEDTTQIAQSNKLKMKTSRCDYSNVCILVNGLITVAEQGAQTAAIAVDGNNKQIMLKNWAPFTDCICKKHNAQADNAKELDVVILMYILIEYKDDYAET